MGTDPGYPQWLIDHLLKIEPQLTSYIAQHLRMDLRAQIAEDIFGEVRLLFLKSATTGTFGTASTECNDDRIEHVSGWLFVTAHKQTLKAIRSLKKSPVSLTFDVPCDSSVGCSRDSDGQAMRAFYACDPSTQRVITEFVLCERSHSTLSDAWGISPAATRTRVCRAKAKLKSQYGRLCGFHL